MARVRFDSTFVTNENTEGTSRAISSRATGPYHASCATLRQLRDTTWLKIKNPAYSQADGRGEAMFPKRVTAGT
jgi:hypothetical protein